MESDSTKIGVSVHTTTLNQVGDKRKKKTLAYRRKESLEFATRHNGRLPKRLEEGGQVLWSDETKM